MHVFTECTLISPRAVNDQLHYNAVGQYGSVQHCVMLACMCRHEHLYRDEFDLQEVYNVSFHPTFLFLFMYV